LVDTAGTGIRTNITFVLQQVTTVVYRKGYANTTADIQKIVVSRDSSAVHLLAELSRGGNSPFFGKISVVVKDSADTSVYSNEEILAVYQNRAFVRFSVPLSQLQTDSCTAEFQLESKRNDLPASDLLQIPTVDKRVSFSVR